MYFHRIQSPLDLKLFYFCISDRGYLEFFRYGLIHKMTSEMDSSRPKIHKKCIFIWFYHQYILSYTYHFCISDGDHLEVFQYDQIWKNYLRNGFLMLNNPQKLYFHMILPPFDLKSSHYFILGGGHLEFFPILPNLKNNLKCGFQTQKTQKVYFHVILLPLDVKLSQIRISDGGHLEFVQYGWI